VELLDWDGLGSTFCRDLGFSKKERDENVGRLAFVYHLLTRNDLTVLVAAISPYRTIRQEVRSLIGDFAEVYVNAPLEICKRRDAKGLYPKARSGLLKELTGIDDPYEAPGHSEVECQTDRETVVASVDQLLRHISVRKRPA
jgi:adenylylsulfate kinase